MVSGSAGLLPMLSLFLSEVSRRTCHFPPVLHCFGRCLSPHRTSPQTARPHESPLPHMKNAALKSRGGDKQLGIPAGFNRSTSPGGPLVPIIDLRVHVVCMCLITGVYDTTTVDVISNARTAESDTPSPWLFSVFVYLCIRTCVSLPVPRLLISASGRVQELSAWPSKGGNVKYQAPRVCLSLSNLVSLFFSSSFFSSYPPTPSY